MKKLDADSWNAMSIPDRYARLRNMGLPKNWAKLKAVQAFIELPIYIRRALKFGRRLF